MNEMLTTFIQASPQAKIFTILFVIMLMRLHHKQ